jgi:hypothetical protein
VIDDPDLQSMGAPGAQCARSWNVLGEEITTTSGPIEALRSARRAVSAADLGRRPLWRLPLAFGVGIVSGLVHEYYQAAA